LTNNSKLFPILVSSRQQEIDVQSLPILHTASPVIVGNVAMDNPQAKVEKKEQ
jgi:hypothetical protein